MREHQRQRLSPRGYIATTSPSRQRTRAGKYLIDLHVYAPSRRAAENIVSAFAAAHHGPAPAPGRRGRITRGGGVRARPKKLRQFRTISFLIRACATLFLVMSTYNPTGTSYVHWLEASWPEDWLLQSAAAIGYVIVYTLLLRTTVRAMRLTGIALVTALLAAFVWVLLDAGVLSIDGPDDLAIILLYMFGTLLAVGISWMRLYILFFGQVSVDRLDR
jgi:hypothetical protein